MLPQYFKTNGQKKKKYEIVPKSQKQFLNYYRGTVIHLITYYVLYLNRLSIFQKKKKVIFPNKLNFGFFPNTFCVINTSSWYRKNENHMSIYRWLPQGLGSICLSMKNIVIYVKCEMYFIAIIVIWYYDTIRLSYFTSAVSRIHFKRVKPYFIGNM